MNGELTELMEEHTLTCLTALCPGLPRTAGTRKVKPIWILLKQETARPYASLHLSPDTTMPALHPSVFLQ